MKIRIVRVYSNIQWRKRSPRISIKYICIVQNTSHKGKKIKNESRKQIKLTIFERKRKPMRSMASQCSRGCIAFGRKSIALSLMQSRQCTRITSPRNASSSFFIGAALSLHVHVGWSQRGRCRWRRRRRFLRHQYQGLSKGSCTGSGSAATASWWIRFHKDNAIESTHIELFRRDRSFFSFFVRSRGWSQSRDCLEEESSRKFTLIVLIRVAQTVKILMLFDDPWVSRRYFFRYSFLVLSYCAFM